MMVLGGGKVVRVRSWSELPEVLEPGVYVVGGRCFVVVERVEREVMEVFMGFVARIHGRYYRCS